MRASTASLSDGTPRRLRSTDAAPRATGPGVRPICDISVPASSPFRETVTSKSALSGSPGAPPSEPFAVMAVPADVPSSVSAVRPPAATPLRQLPAHLQRRQRRRALLQHTRRVLEVENFQQRGGGLQRLRLEREIEHPLLRVTVQRQHAVRVELRATQVADPQRRQVQFAIDQVRVDIDIAGIEARRFQQVGGELERNVAYRPFARIPFARVPFPGVPVGRIRPARPHTGPKRLQGLQANLLARQPYLDIPGLRPLRRRDDDRPLGLFAIQAE